MSTPTYHDLYIETAEVPRRRIFDLPYGWVVSCSRVTGWQLWNETTQTLMGGEYDTNGLRLDVGGHVIVDSLTPEKPPITVLCGSTRFYDQFQEANYDLTMQGRIVLSVGFYPHSKAQHGHGEGVGHDSQEKIALDELHKRKIDLADEVFVLNVGGYIGESTRGEIEYAEAIGKPIRYLEDHEDE